MLILRGLHSPDSRPVALTIGNFDGVHLGHQALLQELLAAARERGLVAAVVIFEPHPRELFAPLQAPARLTSLREKLELFSGLGVERVHVCRFDAQFAKIGAAQFINVLHQELSAKFVLIGDDFRFGSGRSGDFDMLRRAGAEHRFGLEAMQTISVAGERVSSSAVRDALQESDLAHADRLLGRPYSIAGRVIHGKKLGRELGFHTANIQLKRNRLALTGVFAVTVEGVGPEPRSGVANLGMRPTVDSVARPTLEVHLFDFDGDLYRSHLTVKFLARLRNQMKFDNLEALARQIERDVAQARAYFESPAAVAANRN
jgi:riboflavin kinase/FMN adenylyltransferase